MAFGGVDKARLPRRRASGHDVRPSDVALAVLVAALAMGGTAAGVLSAATAAVAEPTVSVLAPGEIAVAVRPVELPSPAGDDTPGTPPASEELPPTLPADPTVTGDAGFASTPIPPRPADAPPPVARDALPERPRGGIKSLPRVSTPKALPPPTVGSEPGDVQPGFGPGGPAVAPGAADPATSPNDPYAYVDPETEDPNAAAGSGMVADEEDPEAGALAARAVVAYRQRLQRWLATRFFLTGTGLSKETLMNSKIRAKLELAADRTVVGYAIEPGGHPVLETAARRALEAVMGKPVPEPPAHYPGPLQQWISVTFRCTEATCD